MPCLSFALGTAQGFHLSAFSIEIFLLIDQILKHLKPAVFPLRGVDPVKEYWLEYQKFAMLSYY